VLSGMVPALSYTRPLLYRRNCLTVDSMKTDLLNFRATPEEKATYEQAAKDCGLSRSSWIKQRLAAPAGDTVNGREATDDVPEPTISPPPAPDPTLGLCPRCTRLVRRSCGVCRQVVMSP
jgi:hypothetical protein